MHNVRFHLYPADFYQTFFPNNKNSVNYNSSLADAPEAINEKPKPLQQKNIYFHSYTQ